MSYENCDYEIFDGEGKYGIPIIKPVYECDIKDWTIFEECRNRNNKEGQYDKDPRASKGVHFFQDDHKFDIVWSQPHKHLDRLKAYGCVLSPDFSMYTDFPVAVQIMQHYKKHWVARWWQEQGLTVIPTICWSTPDSYEWCFDGEPHESIVAVSDIGCSRKPEVRKLFEQGYNAMIEKLNPSKILFFTYGRAEKNYKGNVEYINVKQIKNFER